MTAMRRMYGQAAERSFSYLYLANVIGAMLGTLATAAVLIEILGLHRTSWVAVRAIACTDERQRRNSSLAVPTSWGWTRARAPRRRPTIPTPSGPRSTWTRRSTTTRR